MKFKSASVFDIFIFNSFYTPLKKNFFYFFFIIDLNFKLLFLILLSINIFFIHILLQIIINILNKRYNY